MPRHISVKMLMTSLWRFVLQVGGIHRSHLCRRASVMLLYLPPCLLFLFSNEPKNFEARKRFANGASDSNWLTSCRVTVWQRIILKAGRKPAGSPFVRRICDVIVYQTTRYVLLWRFYWHSHVALLAQLDEQCNRKLPQSNSSVTAIWTTIRIPRKQRTKPSYVISHVHLALAFSQTYVAVMCGKRL